MTASMTFRFDVTEYDRTHGRLPKGSGAWMFEVTPSTDSESFVLQASGTLTEAKKQVRQMVKDLAPADFVGNVYVTVLP